MANEKMNLMLITLAGFFIMLSLLPGDDKRKEEEEARRVRRREEERRIRAEEQQRRIRAEEERRRRNFNIPQQENDRLRILLQRELRRIRLHEEEQRRIRLQEEERIMRRRRQLQEEEERFAKSVDTYIRTRNKFDSRDPLRYRCQLSSVSDYISEQDFKLSNDSMINVLQRRFNVDMNSRDIGVKYLTPFQGIDTLRVFGYYQCVCGRAWPSARSWKDSWQKCQSCQSCIYPYEQNLLMEGDKEDDEDKRPHDQERCERCLKLRTLCG